MTLLWFITVQLRRILKKKVIACLWLSETCSVIVNKDPALANIVNIYKTLFMCMCVAKGEQN